MARFLSEVGTVKYRDFTFPAPISVKVQIRPEYDVSGRVVKWRTYHIQVEAVLVAEDFPGSGDIPSLTTGDPLDKTGSDAMRILRRQLTTPGGNLQVIQQGLGQDLTFTTANVVGYGPKPSVLLWEPLGSAQACRIVWTCEVSAVECGTGTLGVAPAGDLGDFSYTVDFGIAEDGLSTRSISGLIEVNPLRVGNFNLTVTADQYRLSIVRSILPLRNFSRRQNYRLSEDRRFLHFNIVDKENESENPLYPHVVRADIEQRISAAWPAEQWSFDFSGTILVAPGRPREIAWAAFVTAIKPRLRAFKLAQGGGVDRGTGIPSTENKVSLIPKRIDISEKIMGGREMSFHLSFIATTSLKTIFRKSGLWTPVPGSWGSWWQSMSLGAGPHDPRGIAQLEHSYQQERIYDVCVNVPNAPSTPVQTARPKKPSLVKEVEEIIGKPEKEMSWFQYELRITLLKNNQTIISRRIGNPDSESVVELGVADKQIKVVPKNFVPATDDLVVQQRGPAEYKVVLVGTARRSRFPIEAQDAAVIKTINGKPAVAIEETRLTVGRIDRRFSVFNPMYVAHWKYVYALPSADATITIGKHPQVGQGPP